jgi:hypothetical protein
MPKEDELDKRADLDDEQNAEAKPEKGVPKPVTKPGHFPPQRVEHEEGRKKNEGDEGGRADHRGKT